MSRQVFIDMSTGYSTTLLALVAVVSPAAGEPQRVIDLSGSWRLALDSQGGAAGDTEPVYAEQAELPGSLQEQGFGDAVTAETGLTLGLEDSSYYTSDRYQSDREPGSVRLPFCLQPERVFVGRAWFERRFDLPEHWRGKRATLRLERPHWVTEAWIDGRSLGRRDSLATPHVYRLPADVSGGAHTLRLCVDNRMHVDVGKNAHSVSDHTQTNWNGVVGAIELAVTPLVWIDRVRVATNAAERSITVDVQLGNDSGAAVDVTVDASVTYQGGVSASRLPSGGVETAPVGGATLRRVYQLDGAAALWDEFTPSLHDLSFTLRDATSGQRLHSRSERFGLRDIGTRGSQITVNGRPVSLRGALECCVFPLTGYPPTGVEAWRELMRRFKGFGLNHVRFHSYCPPEAAFDAADELGMYLQVEAGTWTSVGRGEPIDRWLHDETQRILETYGNHPSFVLMASGNEPQPPVPSEEARDRFLTDWVTHFRSVDPRRLYTGGAGWPKLDADDFHVATEPRLHQWGAGLNSPLNARSPSTDGDYHDYLAAVDRPVVSHEIGQWCAFPNLAERTKYTGVTRARNYELFSDRLAAAGLADRLSDYVMASGALQERCYKAEVEACLRTPGLAGFQMLGLGDFPGQGTAPVGLCDAFWDPKPYASAKRFREFCGPTAPLVRFTRRVFGEGERLEAVAEVAHYGGADLPAAEWRWSLVADERVVDSGRFSAIAVATGGLTRLGVIECELTGFSRATRCELRVEAPEVGLVNRWPIWVYPEAESHSAAAVPLITTRLDDEAVAALKRGETVVVFADPATIESDLRVGFTPIFWNTSWTKGQAPHTLGVTCDPRHPALAGFPTEGHSDWQWWEVLQGCRAMHISGLPKELSAPVELVPDWQAPERLALLIEARVAQGRLLLCSANTRGDLGKRHAARAFRESLVSYAASERFQPSTRLSLDELRTLFVRPKGQASRRNGQRSRGPSRFRATETSGEHAVEGPSSLHRDGDGVGA